MLWSLTEPIAKVNTLDVHLAELLARTGGHQNIEQRILDIAMAPVLPLDLSKRGDVARAKCMSRCGPEYEEDQAREEHGAQLHSWSRHDEACSRSSEYR